MSRRAVRPVVWLAASFLAVLAGFVLYFNFWFYPALGMSGFSRADSEAALGRAALGYARSTGMAMEGFDLVKFREVEGGEAYVWGAAVMSPKAADLTGKRVLVWVYLTFVNFRRSWVRVDAQILAAPGSDVYYEPGKPGQLERARRAFMKIVLEELRRFREVWS
ncbi:MAG: hypothetical protein HQK81_11070 [Desulfovibrionaceae bacterium]|nr:hypothetical protein [Desulfovibrionaceae bacterium]MBF0514583.1 hypothetical protein [Desulfovibrionaceae bacterium]